MVTPSCKGAWEGEYSGILHSAAEEDKREESPSGLGTASLYLPYYTLFLIKSFIWGS